MNGAVEAVLDELETAGFQRLPKPLVVASASFDFDAAVTGTGVSHDLVVVGGQDADPRQLIQLLSGLNRILDRLESRRPVSVVLLGPHPEPATLSQLEKNARVILVESREPIATEVRKAIAVLLPLHLPPTTDATIDPLDELLTGLPNEGTDDHRLLVDAARIGPEAVRETFRIFLEDPLVPECSRELDL